MKRLLTSLLLAVPLSLCPSCATDATTGKQQLSPEMAAALNRIGVSTITAVEAAIAAKIASQLRVQPSGK